MNRDALITIAPSILGAVATGIALSLGGLVWGWRVLGTFLILGAAWVFWTRRARYIVPANASGALRGNHAIVAGLINLAIGVAVIINANDLANWVRHFIHAS